MPLQDLYRGMKSMMMADRSEGKMNDSAAEMEPETIAVDTDRVACNGGGGALGHPRVWLTLGTDGEIVCPYCSRRYVRRAGGDDA